jgi:hypothetical protein
VLIEIVEHDTWTEAVCPGCGQWRAMLSPRESPEVMRASLFELIDHARDCQPGWRLVPLPGTRLYERLLNERYPRTPHQEGTNS